MNIIYQHAEFSNIAFVVVNTNMQKAEKCLQCVKLFENNHKSKIILHFFQLNPSSCVILSEIIP